MRVSAFYYNIGKTICEVLPRRWAYALAGSLAGIYYHCARADRKHIDKHIDVILGPGVTPRLRRRYAREVFIHFALYLVDFLSFSRVDAAFVRQYVRVEGLSHLKETTASGKGTIILSAHLGNWELGGMVTAILGYPLAVVALAHTQKEVNDFFNKQRHVAQMQVIPLGAAVRKCFKLLRDNKLVAFVGDREFGNNGITMTLFGKKVLVPPGPAYFAQKTGAWIVPSFLVREGRYQYRLIFETPISPFDREGRARQLEDIVGEYLRVIEKYLAAYMTQWYMFADYFSD